MGHLKLVLAFFALVVMCVGVFAAAYFYKHYVEPEREIVREIEEVKSLPPRERSAAPDLGKRQFSKAVEFLEEGELLAAREQMYYIMEHYSDSATYPEAKRLVGEINLDLLFSEIPIEGKTEHVVKSGDLLSLIARDYKCTINYIMRASGRTVITDRINIGERLTVYPLDQFSMVIDKSDQAIRIERDGRLFKEYAVTRLALPSMVRVPASGQISNLSAWGDKGNLQFDDIDYLGAPKGISTSKKGLMIRSSREHVKVASSGGTDGDGGGGTAASGGGSAASGSSGYGVMVAQEDMEELFAYIRPGTPIRLVE